MGEVTYLTAQILGLLAGVCGLISMQLNARWKILTLSATANLMTALNFLLLGQGIGTGFLQFSSALDLMPIVGALLLMVAFFQKKEQHIRWFSLANVVVWIVYDVIVKSSAVISQLVCLASLLTALFRYRSGRETVNQNQEKGSDAKK